MTKAPVNSTKNLYRVRIIYKPGPDLFMGDWLFRHNHNENKDEEITGM